ncbi:MAG: HAMP domain-containing histidine kinase [Chloroflexi bacterium]|nr:HAMP domain-containing histidine kinase [Chloroflexota bacterium]
MTPGGLRGRLAIALVALVALTVVGIGFGTYAFVDARLREGLLADAERQAQFNLSVLVPDRLPAGAGIDEYRTSGLPEAFRLRGVEESIVDFGNGAIYVSSDVLAGALAGFPGSLTIAVAGGRLAYAWVPVAGSEALVVGGRQGAGPAFYFVFGTSTIRAALGQLQIGLVVGGLVAAVVALLAAGFIAGRILVPVRSGSVAAARIAAGDLSARIPETGTDELGAWAAEFNRMATALQATIARLESAQQQNRRFVADVSHELRTPLAALVAEASIIDAGVDRLPPESRRAAELLVADVRRLRSLVEDLMELSRFDAEAEQPTLVPLDLGASVQAIARARLPGAILHLPEQPIVVPAELRRLDRIVGNLLDNARIHAPGSAVEVAVRPAVGAEAAAEVSVADRGPGVEPGAVAHLFDRFYKADASRGFGSSGLGLAIAAEHARLLGGRLTARNREGGGLEVSLRLPVTGSLPDSAD